MIIVKRNECTYYIKDESIVLEYNNQYISFNVYALQNRKRFKDFKLTLLESSRGEYSNINDIVGLASSFGLRGMAGYKPIINKKDTFLE